jgi:hypothetical protein
MLVKTKLQWGKAAMLFKSDHKVSTMGRVISAPFREHIGVCQSGAGPVQVLTYWHPPTIHIKHVLDGLLQSKLPMYTERMLSV